MELFRRRPLFLCCVLCMLACAAGAFLPAAWRWVLFGAVCLGALLAGLWMLCRKKLSASLTAVAAGSLALLALLHSSLYFNGQEARTLTSLEGQSVVAEGIITDRRSNGEYLTSYSMQLTAADGKEIRAQALLTCLYVSDLQPGHVVSMEVTVLPLSEAAGDGYDATALLGDGYRVGLRSDSDTSVTILSETGGGLRVKAGALRRSLSARLGLITKNAEGLPSALLLGDKSGLSDAVRRDFARSGASHLLAISGFHVTLLFGMAEGLLRLLRIRKQIRVLLLSGSAVAYLILLGFPPSATRAVIMLGVVYLSTLLWSRSDPLTSLGLAGAAILTTTPYAVADAGFWMSFLAAFGLVTVMPVVNGLLPAGSGSTPGQKLLQGAAKRLAALAVGVVAMSFTLFIVASITGELGVFSPLTTPSVSACPSLEQHALGTVARPSRNGRLRLDGRRHRVGGRFPLRGGVSAASRRNSRGLAHGGRRDLPAGDPPASSPSMGGRASSCSRMGDRRRRTDRRFPAHTGRDGHNLPPALHPIGYAGTDRRTGGGDLRSRQRKSHVHDGGDA